MLFRRSPGGRKNYIPTSTSDILAGITGYLRWRLSIVSVSEGVTPDVCVIRSLSQYKSGASVHAGAASTSE
jgi:hypothetical protein